MAYSPLWESLASVLKRVVATSISRKKAQEQIANAIADRAIAVRVTIDASAPDIPGWVLEGSCVGVPQQLSPKDFDWTKSRPFTPWLTAICLLKATFLHGRLFRGLSVWLKFSAPTFRAYGAVLWVTRSIPCRKPQRGLPNKTAGSGTITAMV